MARNKYEARCPATEDKKEMSAIVSYDFHDESVQTMTQNFGEAVCRSLLRQKLVIGLQSWIRGRLRAGDSPADIQKKLDSGAWKPGMARPKMSASDKILKEAERMDETELAALLKKIRERREAKR